MSSVRWSSYWFSASILQTSPPSCQVNPPTSFRVNPPPSRQVNPPLLWPPSTPSSFYSVYLDPLPRFYTVIMLIGFHLGDIVLLLNTQLLHFECVCYLYSALAMYLGPRDSKCIDSTRFIQFGVFLIIFPSPLPISTIHIPHIFSTLCHTFLSPIL